MFPLFRFFVELAMLRRGPQDLPASRTLLILLAALSVLIGSVNGADLFGGLRTALGANLLDLLLMMLMLFVLLQVKGHLARWQQTASAFFGLGALAGMVMLLVRVPAGALGIMELAMLADLVVAVWLHVALGGVLRHALDMPLLAGVAIVLSYTIMAFNIIARVFPPVIAS